MVDAAALALLWSVVDRQRLAAGWGLIAVLISHRWLLALHPLTWMGSSCPLELADCNCYLVVLWVGAALLLAVGRCWRSVCCVGARSAPTLAVPSGARPFWPASGVGGSPGFQPDRFFWIGVGGSAMPADPSLAGLVGWIGAGGLAAVQPILGWGLWAAVTGRRFLPWAGH